MICQLAVSFLLWCGALFRTDQRSGLQLVYTSGNCDLTRMAAETRRTHSGESLSGELTSVRLRMLQFPPTKPVALRAREIGRRGLILRATADPCLCDTLLAFGHEWAATVRWRES